MVTTKSDIEKNIPKWKHINILGRNTIDWKSPKVFRYMPISRIQKMFEDNEITFVFPNLWEDPYEKRYYNVALNGNKDAFPNIACLCVTTSRSDSSAAFWNWSKHSDETWLRVQFNVFELLEILDTFADRTNARIYVSPVNYDYTEDEIKLLHEKMNFDSKHMEKSYIKLMSVKRKAFRYENELRIFVVWDRNSKELESKGLYEKDSILKIPFSIPKEKLIKKITLDPRQSEMAKIDVMYRLNLIPLGKRTAFEKAVKEVVQKFKNGIEVQNSGLLNGHECKGISYPPAPKKNVKKTSKI